LRWNAWLTETTIDGNGHPAVSPLSDTRFNFADLWMSAKSLVGDRDGQQFTASQTVSCMLITYRITGQASIVPEVFRHRRALRLYLVERFTSSH
jgi:hypothetical protein